MTSPFEPARVAVLDLADPLPPLDAVGVDGQWRRRVVALVLLDGQPLGVADLDIGTGIGPTGVANHLWELLGPTIRESLGRPHVDRIPVGGFGRTGRPPAPDLPATVVVATCNRPNELALCITSLLALDHDDFDIVVVDNAADDPRAREVVARFGGGRTPVRYVHEPRPGLARAHNAARPHVTGSVIAITDDDVVVDRSWLRWLCHGFTVAEDVGAVTGMIFPAELETPTQAWTDVHAGYNKGYDRRVVGLADAPGSLLPWATGTIGSGANMAFRTTALDAIGWFDDALGAGTPARGGDDLAAFHDVLVTGHRIVYEPGAIVLHRHHRDPGTVRRLTFSYGVALSAHLTRSVVEHPRSVVRLVPKLPAGVRHGARTSRAPSCDAIPGLAGTTWRQRAGMLVGPWSYARSRRWVRQTQVAT